MSSRPDSEPDDERKSAFELDRQIASVYDSLRVVARRAVRTRAGAGVLDPTDLVHECYLKLARGRRLGNLPKPEFLALAATAIRTVLVDHARELAAIKRGGGMQRVTLDGKTLVEKEEVDLLGLEDALTKLGELDERLARIVELRFFGGLEVREIAEALSVSPRTVDHDWSLARAWLLRELKRSR